MAGVDCPTCGKNYDRPEQEFRTTDGPSFNYVFVCERCMTVFDDQQNTHISLAHAANHFGYKGYGEWAQISSFEDEP